LWFALALVLAATTFSSAQETDVPKTDPATLPPPAVSETPPTFLPNRSDSSAPLQDFAFPGRGGMGNGFGFGNGGPGYTATWFPARPVSGQDTNLAIVQQSLRFGIPIWKDDQNTVLFNTHVQNNLFFTDAVFPETGHPFPDSLWNASLGTTYIHRFANDMVGGLLVNIGSSGDQPFEHFRDYYANVGAFLRVPQGERNAWNFGIFYSPLGELAFPIPTVSFFWNPSDDFHMNIGLPLSLWYRPWADLTIDLSYMLLTTVRAQATCRLNDDWKVYVRYSAMNMSWFLSDRTDDRERLFSYAQDVAGGLRYQVSDHIGVDLGAGYAFDRFFFIGKHLSDSQNNRIDVANGAFLSLQASYRW
jgi:hypothetical protein